MDEGCWPSLLLGPLKQLVGEHVRVLEMQQLVVRRACERTQRRGGVSGTKDDWGNQCDAGRKTDLDSCSNCSRLPTE